MFVTTVADFWCSAQRRSDTVSYVLVQHHWIHQLLQHSQDLARYTYVDRVCQKVLDRSIQSCLEWYILFLPIRSVLNILLYYLSYVGTYLTSVWLKGLVWVANCIWESVQVKLCVWIECGEVLDYTIISIVVMYCVRGHWEAVCMANNGKKD